MTIGPEYLYGALGLASMIDMIGVLLKVMLRTRHVPDVVVLHKGRNDETVRGKVIKYKHITKINGKYDVIISAAGGVDRREARSAIFNGANKVGVNIVRSESRWASIRSDGYVAEMAGKFLKTIE